MTQDRPSTDRTAVQAQAARKSTGVTLVIQIPCFDEEEVIADTLASLPRAIDGIDVIRIHVIDDGSSDRTRAVAEAAGADLVVSAGRHLGLAKAFALGLEAALEQGADIIVNTDADNQYHAGDIAALVKPILEQRADMVVGARPISDTEHFSGLKKRLQRLGSWVVRKVSDTDVADAPSGFRALNRETALSLHIFSRFSYTLETIIQAGHHGLRVVSVPVRTNPPTRPSRLFRSTLQYLYRSAETIIRIFLIYRPLALFIPVAAFVGGISLVFFLRYAYFFSIGEGAGHVQSVIVASALGVISAFVFFIGVLADLISSNRKLLERQNQRLWRLETEIHKALKRLTPTEPR